MKSNAKILESIKQDLENVTQRIEVLHDKVFPDYVELRNTLDTTLRYSSIQKTLKGTKKLLEGIKKVIIIFGIICSFLLLILVGK